MHDACDMCGEETPELLDMEEMGVLCPACAEEAELQAMEDERDARADYAADMKMDARRMGEAAPRSMIDMMKSSIADDDDGTRRAEEYEDDSREHIVTADGEYIENPFWDESGREEVDPEAHYGDAFTSSPMAKRLRWGEGANFDKFMDKILISEGHNRTKPSIVEDSPMRKRAARHQERPLGRIRFGGK